MVENQLNLNCPVNYLKTTAGCLQPQASLPVQPSLMTHATLNPSTSGAHFMVTWSDLYSKVVFNQL